MTFDLVAVLDKLQERLPEIIKADNGQQFIYQHANKRYEAIDADSKEPMPQTRIVSTIESLATVAKEEARRLENKQGDFMTIVLDDKGARFTPEDKHGSRHKTWRYNRTPSQQWQALLSLMDKPLNHKALVRGLLSLQPSIIGFEKIYAAYKRILVCDTAAMLSQPVYDVDTATIGTQASWTLKVETAKSSESEQQVSVPTGFIVDLPLVRGSSKQYQLEAEIEIDRKQTDNGFTAQFKVVLPKLDITKDQLLLDEKEYIAKEVQFELNNLLVVVNYS